MASQRDAANRGTNWMLGLLIGVLVGGIGVVVVADRFGTDTTTAASTSDPSAAASSRAAEALDRCTTTTPVTAVVVPATRAMVVEAAAKSCVELDVVEAAGRDGVKASLDADLWVTDSSLWAYARPTEPGAAVSIASSPIVGLATQTTALMLGNDDTFSWPSLLSKDRPVRIGFHDPSATATGLLAAWPFLKAQRLISPVRFEALALTANSLSQPAIIGSNVLGSPPERMVIFAGEYLVEPSNQVHILRGRQGEPYMDFPAYNTSRDAAVRPVVGDLIKRLASADVATLRADAKLRDPDGTAEFDTTLYGHEHHRIGLPGPATAIKLYGLSASGSTPGRILVLMDVSDSMGVLQANNKPLIDQVRTTALIAMATLYDHTSIGVWLYGTGVGGAAGHRELVPITLLGTGRSSIINTVQTIKVHRGSQSTLYESILAGYQALQEDYDPAAAQSLVVFTNKDRDTTSGMSVQSLIARLEAESDPSKPIRVMGVGFGERADVSGLQRVSDAVGGKSARVNGPVAMLGLFINLIGQVSAQG